ncbi:MAG: hypothetical protein IT445_18760 [Phycisphaeraceae bacterium]|nr:hypothetical protein [Phycisphaeraceae bacterium]
MNDGLVGAASAELTERLPWAHWEDYAGNPTVEPPFNGLVADPAIVTPIESSDGAWHMFTCGGRNLIIHWYSDDGVSWRQADMHEWGGFSPFIFIEDGVYHIFYQEVAHPMRVCILCRSSRDLLSWSDAHLILEPTLDWEDVEKKPTVRNPCIVKASTGEYRMYYSGGVQIIPDLGFEEPIHIGVATADALTGPYSKRPTPLMSPSPHDPWRHIGAAAMKVHYFPDTQVYVGFNNGLYRDEQGRVHSALHQLVSEDGYKWYTCPGNPFFAPPGGTGWKCQFVYQVYLVQHAGQYRLYYNGRDGWKNASERIGMAYASPRDVTHTINNRACDL